MIPRGVGKINPDKDHCSRLYSSGESVKYCAQSRYFRDRVLPTSWVALDKIGNTSMLWFAHLQNEDHEKFLPHRIVWGLNKIMPLPKWALSKCAPLLFQPFYALPFFFFPSKRKGVLKIQTIETYLKGQGKAWVQLHNYRWAIFIYVSEWSTCWNSTLT